MSNDELMTNDELQGVCVRRYAVPQKAPANLFVLRHSRLMQLAWRNLFGLVISHGHATHMVRTVGF
jgi:hypothetical protein